MFDGSAVAPKKQDKQKKPRIKPGTLRSIYWIDNLATPRPSNPSPYYTALALGATVVCSAGALMQHTETGLWQQSDSSPSNKAVAQSEQPESDTDVTTPPIATSQTPASFSSRATSCKDSTCQGLEFIDRRMSLQAQLQALRAKRGQLQTKGSAAQHLQTQQAILASRSNDLAQLQAKLEERVQTSNQQFAHLTTRLAIHPDDAKQIANLLNTDTSYQINRLKLSALKDAIAIEYSKPVADNPQLELLYKQYAQELEQLRQIAQTVLANYIAQVSAEFPDPIWQDEKYYSLLQALIDVAHLRQMQIVEHNTLAAMNAQLHQQRTELATLLDKNNSARALGVS